MSPITRRAWLASASAALLATPALAKPKFRAVRPQFIAALAPPDATSGTGAETWGYWRKDPGPIGVRLRQFAKLERLGFGPAGWRFDADDWWLDENGLIMKAPDFPLPPGEYLVTNGETNVSTLAIAAPDATGAQGWTLSDGLTAADVTHGPCRSARYTPTGASGTCSPAKADQSVFPLPLGDSPPMVPGCERQEYAVFIVIGLPVGS